MQKKYGFLWEEKNQTRFTRILEKLEDILQDVVNVTINKIQSKRKRKIKIKIHDYDTWGMDHTLALIILPMLKKLKAEKHGSPWVADEDVPDNLGIRTTDEEPKENDPWGDNVHKRWDWVMNEMIWAFESLLEEDLDLSPEDEMQYYERLKNGLILFGKYYQGLWD